jgi:membrane-associated phospholipid phosphatase
MAERLVWMLKIIILFLISSETQAQDSLNTNNKIPFTKAFYHIDKHFVGSFTYNYGLNYALAGASSYAIVKTGFDWKWYNYSNDSKWISKVGFAPVTIGGLVPIALPLGLYFYGRSHDNSDLQITGLAIGQAAILGLAISSGIKVFTGRVPPDNLSNKKDYSGDFRFGFLRGGAFEGWPSSHTSVAFAMAITLNELYPDNTWLKVGSIAYASFIGLGVSTNIHWFSDAVAGAFIGYAIGKSVGAGFNQLMGRDAKIQAFKFYTTANGVACIYEF